MVHPQTKKELQALISRYLEGKASPEEVRFVDLYYAYKEGEKGAGEPSEADLAALGRRLHEQISEGIAEQELTTDAEAAEPPVIAINARTRIPRWGWAAAAVVCLGSGLIWYADHVGTGHTAVSTLVSAQNNVKPGGNKAILTLGNGRTVTLDSATIGTLAQQGSAKVVKVANGQLAYNTLQDKTSGITAPILYNTLVTPRGGQYQLTLPDGSRVWLNAASSITYPTAFTGNTRVVKMTGEAYFEIAADARRPFKVELNEHERVDVLGTHFNINAYGDEPDIQTTLLEGSIRYANNWASNEGDSDQYIMLKPGQQLQLSKAGDVHLVEHADIDQIIAWKNGSFDFEQADLMTILRAFSRWYDVDVVYEGPVTDKRFFAVIGRNTTLKDVLDLLKDNHIVYRLEGKKLIVQSN